MSGFSIEERGCMALEYYRHNNYEVVKVNFKFTFPDSPIPCDKTILKYFRKIRYFGFAEDKKYSREAPISDNIEIRDKVLDAIEANPKWSHRRLAIETGIKKTTYRTILEKNGVKVFKFTPVQKLYEGDASRRFLFSLSYKISLFWSSVEEKAGQLFSEKLPQLNMEVPPILAAGSTGQFKLHDLFKVIEEQLRQVNSESLDQVKNLTLLLLQLAYGYAVIKPKKREVTDDIRSILFIAVSEAVKTAVETTISSNLTPTLSSTIATSISQMTLPQRQDKLLLPKLEKYDNKENQHTFIERFKRRHDKLDSNNFFEYLKGPALLACRAIEENNKTFDVLTAEWILNFKPRYAPDRPVMFLESQLALCTFKEGPTSYVNKIIGMILELETLTQSKISYAKRAKHLLHSVNKIRDFPKLCDKLLRLEDKETDFIKFKKDVIEALEKEPKPSINKNKTKQLNNIVIEENKDIIVYKLSSSLSKKCLVKSTLDHHSMIMLIDSGSQVSLMSQPLFKKVSNKKPLPFDSKIKVVDVQQNEISILDILIGTDALSRSHALRQKLTTTFENMRSTVNKVSISNVDELLQKYNVCPTEGIHKHPTKIKEVTFDLLDTVPVSNKSIQLSLGTNKKNDSTIRLCVDFTAVNKKIKYKNLPIPSIDTIFFNLHNKASFSTLDLNKGFWQLRLAPSAQEVTAFTFNQKNYQFAVLPFGLAVAPGLFQKKLQQALAPILEEHPTEVFLYIDDILIATKDDPSNLQILNKVLFLLEKSELKLIVNKSTFLKKETPYLGMKLTKGSIMMDPNKLNKLLNFNTPQTKVQLQSFLGYANYLRRFSRHFAQHSSPLYNMINQPKITWNEQTLQSFQLIKDDLPNAPILSAPDLATAQSDHAPLSCIFSKQDLSLRLLKWKMRISEYNITSITHVVGKENLIADALSRCIPVQEDETSTSDKEEYPSLEICLTHSNTTFDWKYFPSREQWEEIQHNDIDLKELFLKLQLGEQLPENDKKQKKTN
uniref:Reverse transcriptase domain-containing protein n=1 Tax=Strongyloides stercoralis TaxID=6248 RepID=A0A0K0EPP6_STRER